MNLPQAPVAPPVGRRGPGTSARNAVAIIGGMWLTAMSVGCGGRSTPPAVAPAPSRPVAAAPVPAQLTAALSLLGTPYLEGGSTPRGFDCSGLVQFVFGANGHQLPRTTQEQFKRTTPVDRREAKPGDLVFFRTTSRGPSHVGILIDATRFVHAPAGGGVVRIEPLALPYWTRRLIGFRRVPITPPPAGPARRRSRRSRLLTTHR